MRRAGYRLELGSEQRFYLVIRPAGGPGPPGLIFRLATQLEGCFCKRSFVFFQQC
ncbi:MAG TPA: hypothetical protein PKD72_09795 [Gemmatales bacterium]|nr:hypothetical protein [Gemmatales bacterium]